MKFGCTRNRLFYNINNYILVYINLLFFEQIDKQTLLDFTPMGGFIIAWLDTAGAGGLRAAISFGLKTFPGRAAKMLKCELRNAFVCENDFKIGAELCKERRQSKGI